MTVNPVECRYNMNWVIPHKLAVGDVVASADGPMLKKNNIKALVTVKDGMAKSREYYKKYGVEVLHIPISDHHCTNIGKYFPLTYKFIEKALQNKQAVLVHCYAGISRSTSITIAYIMRKYKLSAEKALELVRRVRPCCEPNSGFLTQLQQYQTALQKVDKRYKK